MNLIKLVKQPKNIKKFKNLYLEKNPRLTNSLIANNIRPSKVSFSSKGISPCLTAKMGTEVIMYQ